MNNKFNYETMKDHESLDSIRRLDAGDYSMGDYSITAPTTPGWSCYLFGGTAANGFTWKVPNGQEPNWFWRKMQFLCFGNRWVTDKEWPANN
jgi:hypothetical protein